MTDYQHVAVDEFEVDEMPFKAAGTPGKSTVTQTVFNAINVLVGMGVLCLPLGLKLAGWVLGVIMLGLAPTITCYTAILLGRIQVKQPQLQTYSDIGLHTLPRTLYVALLGMFMLDLFGAALTLTIMFTDSFRAITGAPPAVLRGIISVGLFGMSFLPLRLLARLSMLGVASMGGIIAVLVGGGVIKPDKPGSLRSPMPTNLWPESLGGALIAVGIIMAPWAGHVVFPELYCDMQQPQLYPKAVTATYASAWLLEVSVASIGFLMFGVQTMPEISSNILESESSPVWLVTLTTVFLGLLPIAKLPLFTLPVISYVDGILPFERNSRTVARGVVAVALFACSMVVTDFARVQSILGSVICVSTCVTAPLAFYMVVFPLSPTKTRVFYAAIGFTVFLSIICTIAVVVA